MDKRLAIIVLSVFIIVTAGIVTLSEVVIPSSKYKEAEVFLNDKEYLNAIEIYEELGSYKDCADKSVLARYLLASSHLENKEYKKAYENFLLITQYEDGLDKRNESGYAYAQQLMDRNNYEDASIILEVIKDYKNSAEILNQCMLNIAEQLYDTKDYYGVITLFEQKGPFGEETELYRAACYYYALEKSDSGNDETAIVYFTKSDGYSDAQERIKIEKYNYIKSNMDKNNPITIEYLKELKAEGYKDSESIYNEWYAWEVTVLAVNSDTGNRVTNRASISKKRPVIFHYKLTGGAPDEKIVVKIKMYLPNGEVFENKSSYAMKDGSVNWHGWEQGVYESDDGAEGTITMEFYDPSNNLIGKGTVEITS